MMIRRHLLAACVAATIGLAATPAAAQFSDSYNFLNAVRQSDGTKATKDQMAKDVSAFLMWAAEPNLNKRHSTGIAVMIFLILGTMLAYMSYRNVWLGEKH